ncbi:MULTISPECIES: BLUF domain-containing protein [unclassified Moraxella]|uniref:BLUF domain-containing protein n=1 Tax=unclassified Moraxella TaxID=2685852 RepID=UPI003AF672DF
MPIYYILYTSHITLPASIHHSTFHDICEIASKNNKKTGITGFLLFYEGNFLQYLEGNELDVTNLYRMITTDNRHRDMRKLTDGSHEHKRFAEWGMHCINLDKVKDKDPISPVFDEVGTLDMLAGYMPRLITDMQRYYQKGTWREDDSYGFSKGSYSKKTFSEFGKRHQAFLWLQIMLAVLFAVLSVGAWTYKKYLEF